MRSIGNLSDIAKMLKVNKDEKVIVLFDLPCKHSLKDNWDFSCHYLYQWHILSKGEGENWENVKISAPP